MRTSSIRVSAIALTLAASSCAAGVMSLLVACDDSGSVVPRTDAAVVADAAGEAAPSSPGEAFVRQRGCAECHQSDDPDAGALSGQVMPRPKSQAFGSNLTPDPDTGLDFWSDDDFARGLREGVDPAGAPLCDTMPRFPDMSDGEVRAIAAYLRGLPPVHLAVPESRCPPLKPAGDAGGGADGASLDGAGD